ncbi:MAG: hypothetical protein ACOCWQ_03770 [Nanoarchaeota archaeon]
MDEWHYIGLSEQLDQGIPIVQSKWAFELGFVILLALLGKILELVTWYHVLPLAAGVAVMLILVHHYARTDDLLSAVLAVLLFASLPSNVNILGTWFFVPSTTAIPFFFLAIFLIHRFFRGEDQRYMFLVIIIGMALFLIHPQTFLIALLFAVLHYIFQRSGRMTVGKDAPLSHSRISFLLPPCRTPLSPVSDKLRVQVRIASVLLLAGIFIYYLFWSGFDPIGVFGLMKGYLVYPESFNQFTILYNPFLLWGILQSLFVIIGSWKALRQADALLLPLTVLQGLLLVNIGIFLATGYSVLAHFQRILYFWMLVSLPVAVQGMRTVVVYLSGLILRGMSAAARCSSLLRSALAEKEVTIAVAMSMLMIVAFTPVVVAGQMRDQFPANVFYPVEWSDYHDISLLRSSKYNLLVMAPLYIGQSVMPISGKRAVVKIKDGPESREYAQWFYRQDCAGMRRQVEQKCIDVVYSQRELRCPGFIREPESINYLYYTYGVRNGTCG